MNKFQQFTIASSIVAMSLFPQITGAAKRVSPVFANGNGFQTFIPRKGESGWFVINGKTYQSDYAHAASSWTLLKNDVNVDNRAVRNPQLTTFKNRQYLIMDDLTLDQFSAETKTTGVWRLTTGSVPKFESVLSFDAQIPARDDLGYEIRSFVSLLVRNNTLFAFLEDGKIWRTTNGTTWSEIQTSGFPNDVILTNVVESGDKFFTVGNEGEIFRSKNGKSWKSISSPLGDDTIGINIIAQNNTLYLSASTKDTNRGRVWQHKNSSWELIYDHENTWTGLGASTHAIYIIAVGAKDDDSLRILKSTNEKTFTKVYDGNGSVSNAIIVNGRVLFDVHDDITEYLVRV